VKQIKLRGSGSGLFRRYWYERQLCQPTRVQVEESLCRHMSTVRALSPAQGLCIAQLCRTVIEADSDKFVCLQFFSLNAIDQLSYSNQSAQPHQSGSSAALNQLSCTKSAQLSQPVSSAAVHQLTCSNQSACVLRRSIYLHWSQCVG